LPGFTLLEKTMLSQRTVLVLAACSALLISNSLASADDGKLTGKIIFKGAPAKAARVFFHLKDGEFVGAKVQEDGSYKVARVPEGTRKITVEGTGLPAKYASEETSGLTVKVKKGSMVLDIVLE
jgi:hypothetical protein